MLRRSSALCHCSVVGKRSRLRNTNTSTATTVESTGPCRCDAPELSIRGSPVTMPGCRCGHSADTQDAVPIFRPSISPCCRAEPHLSSAQSSPALFQAWSLCRGRRARRPREHLCARPHAPRLCSLTLIQHLRRVALGSDEPGSPFSLRTVPGLPSSTESHRCRPGGGRPVQRSGSPDGGSAGC